MAKDYTVEEQKERTILTELFAQLKIAPKNYELSEVGSFTRWDAKFKGKIFGETSLTNYVLEMKCRNQKSTDFKSMMVAIDKTAHLLLEANRQKKPATVVYCHHFEDDIVALLRITPTILNLPVEMKYIGNKGVQYISVPLTFSKNVKIFTTFLNELFT